MSENSLGWDSMISPEIPKDAKLRSALLTTYDAPDLTFLAEQLLRRLFRLDRHPSDEPQESAYYVAELYRRVVEMEDRLVIVSSGGRVESREPEHLDLLQYGWLRDRIRPLTVGYDKALVGAVQHAKLWMLHWETPAEGSDCSEVLEIVISSTNLTRSAFVSQLQSAWRIQLPLMRKGTAAHLKTWGILPDFLEALARSTDSAARVQHFASLLRRVSCPTGTQFLASIPGRHSPAALRKRSWGQAGLVGVQPSGRGVVNVCVLAPSVGTWSKRAYTEWTRSAGSQPERTTLVWLDREHAWAQNGRWVLPSDSHATLTALKSRIVEYPSAPQPGNRFHEEQSDKDTRWSHAKLYLLQRGHSRRLVLSSANFSSAAWGSYDHHGNLQITNFELGVVIPQATWPFARLSEFSDPSRVAVCDSAQPPPVKHILWASASWDGSHIHLTCRCTEPGLLSVEIMGTEGESHVDTWRVDPATELLHASVRTLEESRPFWAVFRCQQQEWTEPIIDDRADLDPHEAMSSYADGQLTVTVFEDLLLDEFGGRARRDPKPRNREPRAPEEESNETAEVAAEDTSPDSRSGDNYGIAAFQDARWLLWRVDAWQERMHAAKEGKRSYEIRSLLRSGAELQQLFERRSMSIASATARIGATLALEEIRERLRFARGDNDA